MLLYLVSHRPVLNMFLWPCQSINQYFMSVHIEVISDKNKKQNFPFENVKALCKFTIII